MINNERPETWKYHFETMTIEEINELPQFIQDKITVSDEFKARFDPEEIQRKKDLQAEIDKRTGKTVEESTEDEINPEDIPF